MARAAVASTWQATITLALFGALALYLRRQRHTLTALVTKAEACGREQMFADVDVRRHRSAWTQPTYQSLPNGTPLPGTSVLDFRRVIRSQEPSSSAF